MTHAQTPDAFPVPPPAPIPTQAEAARGTVDPPAPPASGLVPIEPDVAPQAERDAQGRRIYGTVLPPSKRIDVPVRFWREDDPEVWVFSARPKLDVTTLRRVGGLMKMAEVQQFREARRQQAAQQRAQAQMRGETPSEPTAAEELPTDVLANVSDILGFVGSMMSDRDGVKNSWDPTPPLYDYDEAKWRPGGKDYLPPPPDTSYAEPSIRMPDGRILPASSQEVADALRVGAGSSKRKWRLLVDEDDEVELGLEAIMEMVGDLVGQWAGGDPEDGGSRPLDEPASSGNQPTP